MLERPRRRRAARRCRARVAASRVCARTRAGPRRPSATSDSGVDVTLREAAKGALALHDRAQAAARARTEPLGADISHGLRFGPRRRYKPRKMPEKASKPSASTRAACSAESSPPTPAKLASAAPRPRPSALGKRTARVLSSTTSPRAPPTNKVFDDGSVNAAPSAPASAPERAAQAQPRQTPRSTPERDQLTRL